MSAVDRSANNHLMIEYLDEDAEFIEHQYCVDENVDVNPDTINDENGVHKSDEASDLTANAAVCDVNNQNGDHDEEADVINQMYQMYV